jgi:hypothetical protein
LHHDNTPSHTSLFNQGIFLSKTTWLSPPSPDLVPYDFFCSPDWRGQHFDTTEVIEAESQVVLNTLTEQASRMHLKNRRSDGNGTYEWEGSTLGQIRPYGSTSPVNYGWPFAHVHCKFNMLQSWILTTSVNTEHTFCWNYVLFVSLVIRQWSI